MDEPARKELALEYCRRMNAGDLAAVLDLFADGARYEDPVGSGPVIGREALRTHFATVIGSRVREEPGRPVAAMDGHHVVLPLTASLDYLPVGPALAAAGMLPAPAHPERMRLRFRLVSIMRIGDDGLLHEVRVLWGRTDVTVEPAG